MPIVKSLGDEINEALQSSFGTLFKQGEFYQLAYEAFRFTAQAVTDGMSEPIRFKYPIGVANNGQPLIGETEYSRESFLEHHRLLTDFALPNTGILGLVTTLEAVFSHLIRIIILRYPQKLGKKKKVSVDVILRYEDLSNIHNAIIDEVLNELTYKSPKEFAESAVDIFGINLLEIAAYHRYIEIKATRDIYVHNQGIANDIYLAKAGSHARAKQGERLHLDNNYFLISYETCLKLLEELEVKFHEIWPSDAYEQRKKDRQPNNVVDTDAAAITATQVTP